MLPNGISRGKIGTARVTIRDIGKLFVKKLLHS